MATQPQTITITHRPRFRANGRRARMAMVALLLFVFALAAHGTIHAWRAAHGSDPAVTTAPTTVVGYAVWWTLLGAGITFVAWFHRAYHNVQALGRRTRLGTGWAIGAWLVPLLQLYRPMQMARELWGHAGPQRVGSHTLVALWWGAALLGVFCAGATASTWPLARDARRAADGVGFGLAADVLLVAAALLAATIVQRVTRAQASMRAHVPKPADGPSAAVAPTG
jgi:hypothetical protein